MAKKDAKKEDQTKEAKAKDVTGAAEPEVMDASPDDITNEMEQLKTELENQKDLLLRTAAEFDNYKRRTERERIAAGEYVKANTIKAFLPVIDNLERSEKIDPTSPEYAKGIEMIVKQLTEAVAKLGLTEIEAVGAEFDPTVHEAIMHIEDDSVGENIVTEVLQKGYKVGDTVVRHAMVKVAN